MGDRLFPLLIWCCAGLVVAVLLWVLGDVVAKGLSHLSWSFLFDTPLDAGRSGGPG